MAPTVLAPDARRIVLCADDYGLAPGIGRAIRALVEAGRLGAVSCMAASPDWPDEAALLRPLDGRADIGLHFSLTGLPPLTAMPHVRPGAAPPALAAIVGRALLGGLDEEAVAHEFAAQLDAFEAHFGRPPDFVDGHQHVHQLPVVRNAVVGVLGRRNIADRVYVRNCSDSLVAILGHGSAAFRPLVIAALGIGFRSLLARAGIATNPAFRGVRAFSPSENYPALFRFWLADAPDGTLVMCHPGLADAALAARDPVVDLREGEFAFLSGPSAEAALVATGSRIARGAFLYTSGRQA